MAPSELKKEIELIRNTMNDHVNHEEQAFNELRKSLEYNNKITEGLVQQVSAVGSDLKSFKLEMKPWLEAKIGLNLIWRWGISIPIIIAVIIGIKTFIGWLGFHR